MSGSGFGLLLALLLVPLGGAALVLAARRADAAAKALALGTALVELVLAIVALVAYQPSGARLQFSMSVNWIPAFGVHLSFAVDGIALVMVGLLALLVPVVIGACWADPMPAGRTVGGFLALILILEALVVGVFAATDVLLFYVLFELMLVPMYFLIGGYGGSRRQYAAVKFFLYSFLGGLLMLGAAIGCWAYVSGATGTGTFDWATLVRVVSHAPQGTQVWLFLGFFIAFAIKAPLVPFHTWLPDATAEAPTGVSVLLVGVLDKVGLFGFLRYCLPMFPNASHTLAPLLLVLAVAGVLYGSLLAAGQNDMKRFIAYVSVAHFGFITLGVFAFTAQSQTGAVTYLVNHGIGTGILLLVIGMIAVRGGSSRVDDYGGMAKVTPLLAGVFLLSGLTALSLPGTNSFVSEFLVLIGSFTSQPVYTIIATVGMVLAALYVLWLYQRVMHGPVRGNALVGLAGGPGAATDPSVGARRRVTDLTGRERLVLAPLVALILVLGFYPQPLLSTVTPSVGATLHAIGVSDSGTAQGGK